MHIWGAGSAGPADGLAKIPGSSRRDPQPSAGVLSPYDAATAILQALPPGPEPSPGGYTEACGTSEGRAGWRPIREQTATSGLVAGCNSRETGDRVQDGSKKTFHPNRARHVGSMARDPSMVRS